MADPQNNKQTVLAYYNMAFNALPTSDPQDGKRKGQAPVTRVPARLAPSSGPRRGPPWPPPEDQRDGTPGLARRVRATRLEIRLSERSGGISQSLPPGPFSRLQRGMWRGFGP